MLAYLNHNFFPLIAGEPLYFSFSVFSTNCVIYFLLNWVTFVLWLAVSVTSQVAFSVADRSQGLEHYISISNAVQRFPCATCVSVVVLDLDFLGCPLALPALEYWAEFWTEALEDLNSHSALQSTSSLPVAGYFTFWTSGHSSCHKGEESDSF